MRKLFFTLLLLGLAACGGASKEQHLARAKDFIAQSDYLAATVELERALQLDSNAAEVRWLLGSAYLETGNVQEAQFELQQAQVLGWTHNDISPALAQALLAQGKFQAVLALDYQDLNAAAAAHLLSSQALAAVSDHQAEKAHALLALAVSKAPQLLQAKLAEATLVVHEGDLDRATALLDALLATSPDSGEAWGLKGHVLAQQGKPEEARVAFDQAIAHSPINVPERLARALINLQLQDYAAAQIDAALLLEHSPKDPAANYVQGLLDFKNKQYRKAITALTLAEPAAREFPLVLYYLSMGYLIDKDLKHATKYADLFVKNAPNDSNGRKLLAAILILRDKLQDARDMLQPALDSDPDDVAALNIMANALLLDHHPDAGFELYDRITQLQPDWDFVPLRREAGLVVPDASDEAPSVPADAAGKTANFPQSDILAIVKLLGEKDFQGAIEAAKSYQYRDLKSLGPYAVLGRVYVAAGKTAEARDVYDKALRRDPGNPAANQGLALLALAAQDPDTARRYYRTILQYYADDLTTLLDLATLEASQNNSAATVAALKLAVAAHPKALEPRLRLAGHYVGAGRPEKVVPLLAKLSALQRQSPRVLEMTAVAYVAQQQYASARIVLQQLVDAKPESPQFHYLLATVARETGDKQKAEQELMEVIKHDPRHMPALIDLARSAHSDGASEPFEQYLATLVTVAPEAPAVLRLRALSAKAKGNHVEALVLAQRAFELTPTAEIMLELAAYKQAAGIK